MQTQVQIQRLLHSHRTEQKRGTGGFMTSLGSRHHQERQVAKGAFYQTSLEPWNHLGKCLNKFQDSNDASSHFIIKSWEKLGLGQAKVITIKIYFKRFWTVPRLTFFTFYYENFQTYRKVKRTVYPHTHHPDSTIDILLHSQICLSPFPIHPSISSNLLFVCISK